MVSSPPRPPGPPWSAHALLWPPGGECGATGCSGFLDVTTQESRPRYERRDLWVVTVTVTVTLLMSDGGGAETTAADGETAAGFQPTGLPAGSVEVEERVRPPPLRLCPPPPRAGGGGPPLIQVLGPCRKGEEIYQQLRSLGASVDWGRACFTLDPVRAPELAGEPLPAVAAHQRPALSARARRVSAAP